MLRVSGNDGNRRFTFDDAALEVVTGGTTIMEGRVENVYLDGNTGSFYGDLSIDKSTPANSRLAREFGELGNKALVQFATGVGAIDLLAATEDLTVSGEMPYLDLVHATAASRPSVWLILGVFVALLAALIAFMAVRSRRP